MLFFMNERQWRTLKTKQNEDAYVYYPGDKMLTLNKRMLENKYLKCFQFNDFRHLEVFKFQKV